MYSPMVATDEQRVMQVLLGLQSNALKFTQKGKVEIQVTLLKSWNEQTDQEDKYLEFSVIDTGIGIEKHNLVKLFQLFGFV